MSVSFVCKFFYVSYIISFMKITGPLQTVNKCKAERKKDLFIPFQKQGVPLFESVPQFD